MFNLRTFSPLIINKTYNMKKIQLLLCFLMVAGMMSAQSLDELRSMKADKAGAIAELQGQIDAINGEIGGLDAQITELTGWTTGVNGLIGFDFIKSNKWVANPNPESSSSALNIGVTTYANKDKSKYFWNNKGIIQKAWQDVNITTGGVESDNGDLFDNGTVDILNLNSLAGYKLHPKLALSAMGELNTSIENFLEPGTADIGIGATWLPIQGMTVVIHPFNYHLAWSANGDADSEGALGAKIRADYGRDLNVLGRAVGWNSTFTTFFPYTSLDDVDGVAQPSLQEFSWLNTLSFELWRGIGVGVGFGVRQAEFELTESGGSATTQTFYNIGLSYGF